VSTEVGKLYVKFDADGRPYIQGLQQIDRRTSQFTRDQQSAFDKFGANIGRTIKTGMAVGAAAVVAGGTLITKSLIKTAASYEYEMSRIKAITQATSDEMAGMSELALELGKDTVFSASEVAAAMTELAKAGQSVGDITGGAIQSVLDLAGAGELQVARAAEIVSNAMNMFGIAASEAAMVADTLAAGANASSVEVSDLAESLMFVGGQAASLGIPFQTVIALISELGNQGIKGSTAGTALSTMLMNLTSATEPGAEALAKMGIEVFDTSGKLKDMDVILGDLNKAMSGLSDAEIADLGRKIFGGGMDATTFKILVKGGSDALKDMTERVSVAGEAGRVNAVKMDNFNGSLEQLRGSVETLTIKVGTPMINALRPFVDKLSEGVDWASEFYDNLQNLSGWEGADLTGKIKIA
jgi:TP901 family phage tail tape measure protein